MIDERKEKDKTENRQLDRYDRMRYENCWDMCNKNIGDIDCR